MDVVMCAHDRKGQRRQPNDFNTLLGIVANKYYAPRDVDLSRTIKSDKVRNLGSFVVVEPY